MVVFTKGELLDQENKLKRSGLETFFDVIVVVSDKTQKEYEMLCKRFWLLYPRIGYGGQFIFVQI